MLTCATCHFFRRQQPTAESPAESFICRRHPKDASVQFIRQEPKPQANRQWIEVEGMQLEAVQYAIATGAANPQAFADDPACGDYADKLGRGYWVCHHESEAKERVRARGQQTA